MAGHLHTKLVVRSPAAFAGYELRRWPDGFQNPPKGPGMGDVHGGRGYGIHLGLIGSGRGAPLRLNFEGAADALAIRDAADTDLALEVGWRKMEVGSTLSFYCVGLSPNARPEWCCRFSANPDGTVSPAEHPQLVLGARQHAAQVREELAAGKYPIPGRVELMLVASTDLARRLVFLTGGALSDHVKASDATAAAAGGEPERLRMLVASSPSCAWLGTGSGGKAIVRLGTGYGTETGGRGHELGLGEPIKACRFVFNGIPATGMAIRPADDTGLALELNWRKHTPGTQLSMWNSDGKPEHAVRFARCPESGTISPVGSPDLVLGAKLASTNIVLVPRGDPLQLVFDDDAVLTARIQAQQEAAAAAIKQLEAEAEALVDPKMLRQLREDGVARVRGAVPMRLVSKALQEINRELGLAAADRFKGKTFPTRAAITDLFNASSIPFVLRRVLGPLTGPRRYHLDSGQIALRFPGDNCEDGTCDCDPQRFRSVSHGWHVDGCPSDFIPGLTDHYGEIHNFDALVGVLLSDLPTRLSGELCTWPGSHLKLAELFRADPGRLDEIKTRVGRGLPTDQTETLFDRPCASCIGKAGDVFIVNYMTAHFIAPNTAEGIRYAVYFRVKGPEFPATGGHLDSILDPLKHWHLDAAAPPLATRLTPGDGGGRGPGQGATAEAVRQTDRETHYMSANNDHSLK